VVNNLPGPKPAWFRFVLVPGLTDAEENLRGLARHMASFSNVERVELLPIHQMGMRKWQGPCPQRNPRRDRAGYRQSPVDFRGRGPARSRLKLPGFYVPAVVAGDVGPGRSTARCRPGFIFSRMLAAPAWAATSGAVIDFRDGYGDIDVVSLKNITSI